jgi:POT family proton-dependent oligopeptide transporter
MIGNRMGKPERHPPGLAVLFFTEMWERFSFYSMVALFSLYLQDPKDGFGWTKAEATSLYANYAMFVYASPLVGGWIADKKIGYRRAVMIGGVFFMAGHLLLSFQSIAMVYLALTCLVIGNGFFKPNVSTMVGNLYPEGSHLKDRAYNIFYMGINVGAFLAPLVAEFVKSQWGVHAAFAVAAGGMVFSISTLWFFKSYVEDPARHAAADLPDQPVLDPALDPPPPSAAPPPRAIDLVPDSRRIGALLVMFATVIVFWMVFHQNGSTLLYWADNNTDWTFNGAVDWQPSGTVSHAINPFWVITLTFPLVWFWKWLDGKGLEPSTPMKMTFGMFLVGASFLLLYLAAREGEAVASADKPNDFKVSPLWLISAYFVMTLGELCLSPMGLSLVSKVAPLRMRGLLMGSWFVATAIGNKLTMIGVYWDRWLHSSFFALLGFMAVATAFFLLLILRPLKRSMPGV